VNLPKANPDQRGDCLPHRVRIVFRKGEIVKYISNLDLLRAWERILRRARLPLAYTQGFNPHPRITIAMPLAVGCSGENEVLDVLLEVGDEDVPDLARTVRDALEPAMPPGISFVSVAEVSRRDPAMATRFAHARYRIALEGIEHAVVESRITELMGKSKVPIQFRRKTFDLRPLIGSLALLPTSSEEPDIIHLDAILLRDERGRTGRPDTLVQALELEPYVRQMVRQELVFQP
jgi:radical SAM-linked protein